MLRSTAVPSLLLLSLAAVSPAIGHAQQAAPPPAAEAGAPATEAGAPPEDPRVGVTVFTLPHPDLPDADVAPIMLALESGLKKNARLEMKDLVARLADFANEAPQDQIDAARAALAEGGAALAARRIPVAVARLEDAVAGLSRTLAYVKKQELADAMAQLAVAQYEGGDKKAGRDQLLELHAWRPDHPFDAAVLPAKYAAHFEEARRAVESGPRGQLTIRTEPEGASVYIDGRFVGASPCSASDLAAGKHFVTFKKEGFRKSAASALVVAKKPQAIDVRLERSDKYLLVEQARAKVEGSLGSDVIDAEVESLRQVLFIDQAVFLRTSAKGDRVAVEALLYDLRTRRRLSRVSQDVPRAGAADQLASIAPNLYLGVRYDGTVDMPEEPPPTTKTRPPVYKQWWFWTPIALIVGGGAAAAGGIVATAPAGCPDGSTCFRLIQ